MLLFKYMGVNKLFLCTIQWWHPNECSNEHCGQTTDDQMLKFLEEVKPGFIFTLVHFKIAKEKYLAKNLEKRPSAQFWPKMSFFKENATSNFHETFKNKYFEHIYIHLGMVTYEGAAHFFLGPKTQNFVISCWDRLNGIQKNCPKNNTKNDPSIAHSYLYYYYYYYYYHYYYYYCY